MSELMSSDDSTGGMIEVASNRVMQEIQAAMTVAKRFPRNEIAALAKIKNACKRIRLAEAAVYSYPKGGSQVEGPSIRLAETLAQCWGNLDFGVVELEQKPGESSCMSYCWDLETNTRQTKIFTIKHERHTRSGATRLQDPRDVYELVANQGARRLRACILGVVPGDIVDEALEEVNATLKNAGDGNPLADRVNAMATAFEKHGVTSDMIAERLGHNLDATSEQELVNLRKIFVSLKDGMSKRDDWFKPADQGRGEKAKVVDASDLLGESSDK